MDQVAVGKNVVIKRTDAKSGKQEAEGGCQFKWEKPKDDGAGPIDTYLVLPAKRGDSGESTWKSTEEDGGTYGDPDYYQPTADQVMHFNIKYMIAEKTFWKPAYVNYKTVNNLLKQIDDNRTKIKVAYANDRYKDYIEGYSDYHISYYLLETLVGEKNIPESTTINQIEDHIQHPHPGNRLSVKVNNLKLAIQFLYPNHFNFVKPGAKLDEERLTPEFVKELHKIVTNDLLDLPGFYRNTHAAPRMDKVYEYLEPDLIEENMNKLCKLAREVIKQDQLISISDNEKTVKRIKIAATFMAEFLHIHPFRNGNGRTARLLVSWIMSDVTIVPVPLITTTSRHAAYIRCLQESRLSFPFKPGALARLILESIVHSISMVCFCLDL